jgi:hypothetical protein
MPDARRLHVNRSGPKPSSRPQIFGQDLLEFLGIAAAPVAMPNHAAHETVAGLSLAEFAAWAGIDRRRLARHLVEIGPGSVPQLPPGKVPVRVFGKTRRIFLSDVFGEGARAPGGESNAVGAQEADTGAARRTAWDRSLDLLRHG